MSAIPAGWGVTSALNAPRTRKAAPAIKTRDLAADIVEWTLAEKRVPTPEQISEHFGLARASGYRWNRWALARFAGRFA